MAPAKRDDRVNHERAAELLKEHWTSVTSQAEQQRKLRFVRDKRLANAISKSINHPQVAYRFCLPIQVLGKLTNSELDVLALQRGKSEADTTTWDARSLGSKIVAPFNQQQESVLGTSTDPYVGNAMRIPRMLRDDKSKRDLAGWNTLIDVLEQVQQRNDTGFTGQVFDQVLLEIHQRQRSLRFAYPVPPRTSLAATLELAETFLSEKSGGDRALALAGALFDVIGVHFGLFAQVNRARINASDQATGQAADLECVSKGGDVAIAVEVKDRILRLSDLEATIAKSRNRRIRDVFFTAPQVNAEEAEQVEGRIAAAFTGGQNIYVIDFFELARPILALGGEAMRTLFLKKVGEHLDSWNTQPSHRQAWKRLLEKM
ncbi:MAG: hypothetical protein DLM52_04890 [Chthoniobacterales bacterium]|nr:MAG: hypothetical protein DLM52_04890 [Chthoniobacterales bacterium]